MSKKLDPTELLNQAAELLSTAPEALSEPVDIGLRDGWNEALGAFAKRYSEWFAERSEELKDHCPECGAGAPAWRLKNKSKDWGDLGTGPRFHCDACDAYRVIPTSAVGQK